MRAAGIILAAGASSRFGEVKAIAPFQGRPLLQYAIDAAAAAGLAETVVVIGASADRVLAALGEQSARVVVNPTPELGLSSSLKLALAALPHDVDAAAILLGDQPTVRADVIRKLLAAAEGTDAPIVAPRYAGGGGANPVVLRRRGWSLLDGVEGDRGLASVIARHPELVHEVAVAGQNPDVDTPADLAALEAESAWAARVRANREQVDRLREVPDGRDFYASVSAIFRADPRRTNDPVLDRMLRLAEPFDVWLDIGAGAGRYALPLALAVREVIAVEPSDSMLAGLRDGARDAGVHNVRIVQERWPPKTVGRRRERRGKILAADVALIAHVGYDIEEIGPFLGAMEGASSRLCVAVLMERSPASVAYPFWQEAFGEPRAPLPALPEFVDLLRARGRKPALEMVDAERRIWSSRDELLGFLRRQLWVDPGGRRDKLVEQLVEARLERVPNGFALAGEANPIGIVTWAREERQAAAGG